MKLYNTLTRTVDEIQPVSPDRTTVYTCGPTVYDYPHIGNWFTFIRYDVLVRALKKQGMNPDWVMNITDVGHLVSDADEGEDKLEKGARREGKTAWEVAQFYGDYFVNGLQRLNITQPAHLTKATEHIEEQIALVKTLEEKGYTYTIRDGVYYDTRKFEGYASFARLDLDDQQAGARVEFNPQKRNSSDFALWKFSPAGQQRDMEWESPWGRGFPGWHLECSAMAMKYLGETIDIHSGGIDHIPVHHTNEVAQSEAATGKRFANYWMHANHISIEGEKISKSLGNTVTLEDIEGEGYSLQALRLHVLESHYRSQSKFSWDSLTASQNRLKNWQAVADLRFQPIGTEVGGLSSHEAAAEHDLAPLSDDLATPQALANIDRHFAEVAQELLTTDAIDVFTNYLKAIDEALGITLNQSHDITDDQKQLIRERDEARSSKDWARSDELRDQLSAANILLRDTPQGSIWYRA
jgi:cysteinyl-tRNA synthetase